MAAKQQKLNFTVNVDIIAKANQQVDNYVKDLNNLKKTMGERLSASFIDDTVKSIKLMQREMNNAAKIINNPKLSPKDRFAGITETVSGYSKIIKTIRNADKKWIEESTRNNDAMLKQLDMLIAKRKDLGTIKGSHTKAKKAVVDAEQELAALGYEGNTGAKDLASLQSKIKKKKIKLRKGGDDVDKKALKDEITLLEAQEKALDKLIAKKQKIKDINKEVAEMSLVTGHKTSTSDIDEVQKRLDNKIADFTAKTEDPAQVGTTKSILQNRAEQYIQISVAAEQMNEVLVKGFRESEAAAAELSKTTGTLRQIFAQFGIGFSIAQVVRKLWDGVQAAYQFYKSLDAALNEIYVVSSLSSQAVGNLKDNFLQMAEDTGMALDDVTRAATLFYQQGLSTDEVMEMTEVTAQFAKVAGIDAVSAADKLTAAVNGYCLSAEDASLVADKFNKVAAASAADINELSTAFSKAAAQANQAGIGMDNYLAYIATMVEATREAPENIGTSLKTIMARMQQVKESGTTEDGETDVNKVETALSSVGVALRDAQGELRDLEDVLGELGPKWDSLDRNTQAYLGTIIAGTRQQSRFITLMQNWDRVLELSEDSANSAGQQALMHAKAMDSITSKTQQMHVAMQEFISNLASSELFKAAIDGITAIIKAFSKGTTPIQLIGAALFLFRNQIMSTIKALGGWISYQTKWVKTLRDMGKIGKDVKGLDKLTATFKAQAEVFRKNKDAVAGYQEELSKLEEAKLKELRNPKSEGDAGFEKQKQDIEGYNKRIEELKTNINDLEGANQQLLNSYSSLGSTMMVLYTIFEGMSNSTNKFASGAGHILKFAVAAGLCIVAFKAVKVAIDGATGAAAKFNAVMSSNIIGLILMAVAAVVSIITQAVDAFTVSSEEMKEAIGAVKESLDEYNNALTAEKGAKKMLEDYEELSNKVYRTASEQERLNSLAQELGDSLELEIIEDQFGNLSVAIEDVKDKLEELEYETEQARQKMIETELEQIESLDNNWFNKDKVAEFYEGYIKGNRASLRNVMGEINTGLETDELATSAQNVQNIMTNLKNNIINDTADIAEAFGGFGDNWTLTQQVESLAQEFNNANLNTSDWNGLFRVFENLQGQIDEMTYQQTFNIVEAAVQRWGKAAQLSETAIKQMTEAVMNSLYGNDNIQQTLTLDEENLAKRDGTYYTQKIQEYEDLKASSDDPDQRLYYDNLIKQTKKRQEEMERFLWLEKEIALYQQQGWEHYPAYIGYLNEYNELKKEYNFLTKEEAELIERRANVLRNLTGEERAIYNDTGLFDAANADLFAQMEADGAFDKINAQLREGGADEGNQAFTEYLLDLIENTDDKELRKQAEEVLEGVLSNIEISGSVTWTDLHETLETITEDLRSVNSIIQEFSENGGITLDTFGELAKVLDDIDIGALANAKVLDDFIGALDQMKLGFDETTGLITANGDAMQSMQVIQAALTKAKIITTKEQLKADRAALYSQIYTVEAEIAANEALIDYLKDLEGDRVSLQNIQAAGNVAYTKKMGEMVTAVGEYYFAMTEDSETWSKAAINNTAQVAAAVKAFINGDLDETNLKRYLSNLVGSEKFEWQYTGSAAVVEGLEPIEGTDDMYDKQKVIEALTKHNEKGRETIKDLYARVKSLDNMIDLLEQMENADLSKLGLDPEELEKYLGELEEIYNTLRKIEGLQNRINHLEAYGEITYGKAHANYLQERIAKSKELIGQQEELLKQQKYLEQTEQNAIKSSAVGDVFSFDEFGNIIIDYEKYNALQDEGIEGQITQKELADQLYEEYQDIHDTTNTYYEDLIDSVESAIDAQQELVDTYIDLEKEVAESVKDTYQEMLDNKLEAIDAEIEAMDKLKEAHDRANQAKQDSEELSDLQTSLKRSMMDTSGASNTKVLSYQDQIKEKLEQMGEDEYTRRLDAITEALEEEKDQLQRNFDEFFEDWEQFHDMIENRIMGDEDAIMEVLKNTDEYKKASDAERREMEKEWSTQIADSVTGLQEAGMDVSGVQDSIISLQNSVVERLDDLLRNGEVTEVGTLLSRVLAQYKLNADKIAEEQAAKKAQEDAMKKISGKTSNDWDYEPTIKYDPGTKDEPGPDKDLITLDEIEDEYDEMAAERNEYTGAFKNLPKDTVLEFKPGNGTYITAYEKADKTGQATQVHDDPLGDWNYKYKGDIQWSPDWWGKGRGAFVAKFESVLLGHKRYFPLTKEDGKGIWTYKNGLFGNSKYIYKKGGIADFTGPAWLDGTKSAPEAVLNAAQTKAFMRLGRYLELTERTAGNVRNAYIDNNTPEVYIESIDFHVDSMSSVEDGKIAFDAFVDEFKRIGRRTGIAIERFKI